MLGEIISRKTEYKVYEFLAVISIFLTYALLSILTRSMGDNFPVGRAIYGALIFGIITAVFEINLSEKLEKKLSQGAYIAFAALYYFLTSLFLLILMAYATQYFKYDHSFIDSISTNVFLFYENLGAPIFEIILSLFIFVSAIILLRHNIKLIGHGVFSDALRGRYRNPNLEDRIFLFMDLRSSTTYAETLGAKKYSSFIKDIFKEMDDAILETEGQLYQYVGDQVVIVWKVRNGVKNLNCVRLSFLVKKQMVKRAEYYLSKYGVFPEFKSAAHFGEVAIAEVGGILKREIAYHGDAINTTARICSKCGKLNEEIIISEDLLEQLNKNDSEFKFEPLGGFQLRGKKNSIELYRIFENHKKNDQIEDGSNINNILSKKINNTNNAVILDI